MKAFPALIRAIDPCYSYLPETNLHPHVIISDNIKRKVIQEIMS